MASSNWPCCNIRRAWVKSGSPGTEWPDGEGALGTTWPRTIDIPLTITRSTKNDFRGNIRKIQEYEYEYSARRHRLPPLQQRRPFDQPYHSTGVSGFPARGDKNDVRICPIFSHSCSGKKIAALCGNLGGSCRSNMAIPSDTPVVIPTVISEHDALSSNDWGWPPLDYSQVKPYWRRKNRRFSLICAQSRILQKKRRVFFDPPDVKQ